MTGFSERSGRAVFVPETIKGNWVLDKRKAIVAEIPKLRRFARALVGDLSAADDLVQDCLERALGRLHLWRKDTCMRAWLFTILRNLHINQIRYSARRPTETLIDEHHELSEGTSPAQGQRMMIRDLGQALEKLPDQQREIILLVGLENMSYKETAEILSVPVGTIMSRLSRGRETLRILMDDGDQDDKPPLRRVK